MSLMCRLVAVIFSACVLNSQAQFIMKYKFNLYTHGHDVKDGAPIQNAAQVAVASLREGRLDGKVQQVANPTKAIQKINGVNQTVWEVLLNIQFPDTTEISAATAALTYGVPPFSWFLQDQLRKEGIKEKATISKAELQAPGKDYVDVKTPTTVAPLTTTAATVVILGTSDPVHNTTAKCKKSRVVFGLLTFFLGGFGAGRFYYGYIAAGVGWIFFTLFAHTMTTVATIMFKDNNVFIGVGLLIPGALAEIGCLIWWLVDILNALWGYLKPYDEPDCTFF